VVCNKWEVGTLNIYTYLKESEEIMGKLIVNEFSAKKKKILAVKVKAMKPVVPEVLDAKLEDLVRQIIERVADKWTMLVLEVLEEHGVVRFTRLGHWWGRSARRC
jgi:hypothetical protein